MNALAIDSVARNFVDAITPLMGGHSVTVMDVGGSILASSHPDGAGGGVNYGAVEAARQRRPIRIRSADIDAYPGAREGVCLPVIKNDELLGVVAIQGDPEEVEGTAGLLAACVGLYCELSSRDEYIRQSKDMRLALLRDMTANDSPEPETLLARAREVGFEPSLPVRVLVFSPLSAETRGGVQTAAAAQAEKALAAGNRLDATRDAAGVLDGALVVLKHVPEGFDVDSFAEGIHAEVNGRHGGVEVGIGVGRLCEDWRQLALSRHEAQVLSEIGGGVRSIDDPNGRMYYMLKGSLDFGASARYLANLEAGLRRGIGSKDYRQVMRTIRAYCDADCHGGRAAENLGIHKNTMNYRMNKIVSLLGLEQENAFVREFFLRLLVLRNGGSGRGVAER